VAAKLLMKPGTQKLTPPSSANDRFESDVAISALAATANDIRRATML
jgi:hypothetical protein